MRTADKTIYPIVSKYETGGSLGGGGKREMSLKCSNLQIGLILLKREKRSTATHKTVEHEEKTYVTGKNEAHCARNMEFET